MLDEQRGRRRPGDLLPAADLADVDQLGAGPRAGERLRRDQAVVEDHVGARDQLERAHREQAGVAGPGAHEVGGHRPSTSSAPAARSATARPRRRAPRARRPPARRAPRPLPSCAPANAVRNSRAVGARVGADGRLAVGAQRAHERPLGQQRALGVRRRARRRRAAPRRARVVSARQPWPGAGTSSSIGAPSAAAPEAREPGRGEHDRVGVAGGELAQARVDVAAQLHDLEVGPQRAQLRGAAQRRGPDARALGQRGEAGGAAERVARVGARGHRGDARCRRAARRARPWRSGWRSRCARRAARRRARATQRSLSAGAAPAGGRRSSRSRRARARPAAARRLAGLGQRQRAAPGADPHAPRRRLAGGPPRPRPRASRAARRRARTARARAASARGALLGAALQADRRLVQQALHDRAGDGLDAREVARPSRPPSAPRSRPGPGRRSPSRARAAR